MVRFWISWKRTLCQAWLADIFEVVKRKGLTNLKTEEVIFVIEFKVNLAKCDLLISFSMAIESAAAPDSWHMCQQSSLSHSKRGGNLSSHTSQNMQLKLQLNKKENQEVQKMCAFKEWIGNLIFSYCCDKYI